MSPLAAARGSHYSGWVPHIILEGPDGVGKSSIMPYLRECVHKDGHTALETREQGSPHSRGCVAIANLLKYDTPNSQLARTALFIADRAEHYQEVIGPAIAEGKVILSDRGALSTWTYQEPWKHEAIGRLHRVGSTLYSQYPAFVITAVLDLPDAELDRRMAAADKNDFFDKRSKIARVNYRSIIDHVQNCGVVAKTYGLKQPYAYVEGTGSHVVFHLDVEGMDAQTAGTLIWRCVKQILRNEGAATRFSE